jgi:hypothetical protein
MLSHPGARSLGGSRGCVAAGLRPTDAGRTDSWARSGDTNAPERGPIYLGGATIGRRGPVSESEQEPGGFGRDCSVVVVSGKVELAFRVAPYSVVLD